MRPHLGGAGDAAPIAGDPAGQNSTAQCDPADGSAVDWTVRIGYS
jgi:hypothetical protein